MALLDHAGVGWTWWKELNWIPSNFLKKKKPEYKYL